MPSTVDWIAGNGDFNNPNNWKDEADGSHHVPTSADDAVINIGTNYTVTVQESHTLKSLNANVELDVSNNAVITLNNPLSEHSMINELVLASGTAVKTEANYTSIYGSSDLSGNLDVADSATLYFSGGTQTLKSGVTLTWAGTGQFSVYGANLTLNTDLNAPANFELHSGYLSGAHQWTVNGTMMMWTGGTMSGTGTTLVKGGGNLVLSGTDGKILDTRSLTIEANSTVTMKGSGILYTEGATTGPAISNAGTWDFQSDSNVQYYSGVNAVFTNTGTFGKSGGTGTSKITTLFDNNGGTVAVTSGNLTLSSGASTGGTYNATNAGSNLDLTGGGTQALIGTYTGSGSGTVTFGSGNLHVLNAGVTFNFPTGLFQWAGGTIYGEGPVTNTGDLTLATTNGKILDSTNTTSPLSFANPGTLIMKDGGILYTENGPAITNSGSWTIASDANVQYYSGVNTVFTNTGTLSKSAGTGASKITTMFDNAGGTVAVTSGGLVLSGGASTGGTYIVAPSFNLDFTGGGTQALTGSYTGSGGGTVTFSSGYLDVLSAGAKFDFAPGMFQWTSGTIYGTGTLENDGDLTLAGTGSKIVYEATLTFVNAGTLTQQDSGFLYTEDGPAISNTGSWTIASDTNVQYYSGVNAVFTNTGTLSKSGGTGTSTISTVFNNNGVVNVQSGTLRLTGGSTAGAPTSGTFDVATPLGLDFGGGTFALATGTTFTDTGLPYVTNGTVSVQGVVSADHLAVNGGTLQLTPSGVLNLARTYTQTGGTLEIDILDGIDFGQLHVSAKASLGGVLSIVMLNGYRPDVGTVFTVLSYGSYEGTFAAIYGLDLGGGIKLQPVYGDTAFTLTTISTTGPESNPGDRTPAHLDASVTAPDQALSAAAATDAAFLETGSTSAVVPVVVEALPLPSDQAILDEVFRA